MPERPLEEVAFDKRYMNRYLALREELAADGTTILGVVVAYGDTADEVHAKLMADQRVFADGKWHFYKPATGSDRREGWTIGGND